MDTLSTAATAERALLGALLYDRDTIASVADRITPAAFQDSRHAAIFAAVLACWQERTPPDCVTVQAALRRSGVSEETVPLSMLVGLVADCDLTMPCHALHYAGMVVEYGRSRALSIAAERVAEAARNDPRIDPGQAMRDALASLPDVGAAPGVGPRSYGDLVPDFEIDVNYHFAGQTTRDVTPTGFGRLDRKLRGGFRNGELTILGARPAMGKSALALQLAHNVARAGKHVLFFSAEMSAESLLWRAAAEISRVPPRLIEDRTAPSGEHERFMRAITFMDRLPVSIDDTSGITVAQMIARTQSAQVAAPVGLVIFDYLELAGDTVKGDNEVQRVSSISRRLKHLARTCHVPVLALCQLNRGVETRGDPKPRLADLRQSGSIEADADVVLLLYRESYYIEQGVLKQPTVSHDIADVIVAKHRNGPTGPVSLRFREGTMTFEEIDQ